MTSALKIAMSTDEAKRITTRIRLLVVSIAENTEKVVDLIEKAKGGDAWRALGYESWPAYVVGEFGGALARLEKADRVPLVSVLAETGMSTRAIASVTGVSKDTVRSDINELATSSQLPANVVSLDGKERPRKATLNKAGQIDAKSTVEFLDAVPPVTRRRGPRHPDHDRGIDHMAMACETAVATLRELHHESIRDRRAARQRLDEMSAALMLLPGLVERLRHELGDDDE